MRGIPRTSAPARRPRRVARVAAAATHPVETCATAAVHFQPVVDWPIIVGAKGAISPREQRASAQALDTARTRQAPRSDQVKTPACRGEGRLRRRLCDTSGLVGVSMPKPKRPNQPTFV